jgi:uncharacterized protein with von Willebrand factor type A (vWA) domain
MLVERLKKFTDQLPKAQAKLDQRLQRLHATPAAGRADLVRSMRQALQALAQGECCTVGPTVTAHARDALVLVCMQG